MSKPSRYENVKEESLARYAAGDFYTTIERNLGVPRSTMCRWATAAGIARSLSVSKAMAASAQPSGKSHRGTQCEYSGRFGWIRCDSSYELARLLQLDAIADVVNVRRCDDVIAYEFEGRDGSYNPDLLVEMANGLFRVEEVKPQRFLTDPRTAAKLAAGCAYYANRLVPYLVVTEDEIGKAFIAASADAVAAQAPDDVQEARRTQRQARKTAAQKVYYRALRARMTDTEVTAFRAYHAVAQSKHRAARAGGAHAA